LNRNRDLRLAAPARVLTASDDRTVEVIASTGALNAYGYVIDQSGWDLARFSANPVVFYDHAWDAPDASRSLPIGRAEIGARRRCRASHVAPLCGVNGSRQIAVACW